MYQTWDEITPATAVANAVGIADVRLSGKEDVMAYIHALEKRLELLQGVSGIRSTIGKQGKKIQQLSQKHAKVRERSREQSRQIISLKRQITGLENKVSRQCGTIEQLAQRVAEYDCENTKLRARWQ